jgi:2'-5' RNA ligase
MHLTLHFLTDAPPTIADDLGPFPLPGSFRLTPGRLLLLPESGPVRVIAASLAASPGLTSLHSALGTELSRLGLPVEPRAFLPHLTLARADPALPQQVRAQTPISPREDLSFPVERVELIESRPAEGAGGFEYRTLRTWGLPG